MMKDISDVKEEIEELERICDQINDMCSTLDDLENDFILCDNVDDYIGSETTDDMRFKRKIQDRVMSIQEYINDMREELELYRCDTEEVIDIIKNIYDIEDGDDE